MWEMLVFYFIFGILYFVTVRKQHVHKWDFIVYNVLMIVALTVFTLYFFGVRFPYLVHVLDTLTQPLSGSLRNWINHFHSP